MTKYSFLAFYLFCCTQCKASDSTTVFRWPELGVAFSLIQGKYSFPEHALYAAAPFNPFSTVGAGIYARMNLGRRAWLSPEFMFYARRIKSDYEYLFIQKFKSGVLLVDGKQWMADGGLIFGFGFLPNDANVQPFASTGMCLGFNLHRRVNQDWKTADGLEEMDIEIHTVDTGLVFGLGANVKLGKAMRWTLEARYSISETNVMYIPFDRTNMRVQRVVLRAGLSKLF